MKKFSDSWRQWSEYSNLSTLLLLFFLIVGIGSIIYIFSDTFGEPSNRVRKTEKGFAALTTSIEDFENEIFPSGVFLKDSLLDKSRIEYHFFSINKSLDSFIYSGIDSSKLKDLYYIEFLETTNSESESKPDTTTENNSNPNIKDWKSVIDIDTTITDSHITYTPTFKLNLQRNKAFFIIAKNTFYQKCRNKIQAIQTEDAQRKILLFINLLFACFAGLVFLMIGKTNNKLIQSDLVKIYTDKTKDSANLYMALAISTWIISAIFAHITTYYCLFPSKTTYALRCILSTINSYFLLVVMYEIDFKVQPKWKNNTFYRQFFGNLRNIRTVFIVLLIFELFSIYTHSGNSNLQLILLPDILLSLSVIGLLWLHLRDVFYERNRSDYISLLMFILVIILFVQLYPIYEIYTGKVNYNQAKEVLNCLYQILLVCLFLFLSDSWNDYFRGEKLAQERGVEIKAKRELDHRIGNYIRIINTRIKGYLYHDKRLSKVQNPELLKDILIELRACLSALQNMHASLSEEGDLYSLFESLKESFSKMFESGTFEMEVSNNLKDCRPHPKDVKELGKLLNEFITNASKHSDGDKYISIKLKLSGTGDSLFMSINDKNPFFDIEKQIDESNESVHKGFRSSYNAIKSRQGDIFNFGNRYNGNNITITFPFTKHT